MNYKKQFSFYKKFILLKKAIFYELKQFLIQIKKRNVNPDYGVIDQDIGLYTLNQQIKAINKLSGNSRIVFQLYISGYTVQEISNKLNISAEEVVIIIKECRKCMAII